jgi:hypothetical protein
MSIVWTIAEQAMRQQMSAAASAQFVSTGKGRLALCAVAAVLVVLAAVFGGIGFYLWLEPVWGPAAAAGFTALALFVAAVLCIGINYLMGRARRREREILHRHEAGMLNDLLAVAAEELEEPIQNYPKTAALVAALAGLIAGKHLH